MLVTIAEWWIIVRVLLNINVSTAQPQYHYQLKAAVAHPIIYSRYMLVQADSKERPWSQV